MKRVSVLFIFYFSLVTNLFAQTCTINESTRKVCLGNTVSFSVSVSGGGTISGYSWNFGNSATNTQSSPVYQYPTPGTYTPTVIVNFVGGGSCSATGNTITVFDLPHASFMFTTATSQCFNGNAVCIKNTSTPGSNGAPIDTANLNWDDGSRIYFNAFGSQVFCHTYTDPFGGIYTVVLEVSDTNGCLSRIQKLDSITIFPKMGAVSFATNYILKCPQTPVKFINLSGVPKNQIKSIKWLFGDGDSDLVNLDTFTHIYTKSGLFTAKLFIVDINNCVGSYVLLNAAQNAKLDPFIHISPNDNSCFKGNKFTITSNNGGAIINWSLYDYNTKIKLDTTIGDLYFHHVPDYVFNNCGKYLVHMDVNFVGTSCKVKTDTIIDVYGPNAVAQNDSVKIVHQIQCQIHDTVYFVTPIPYLDCHNDNLSMKRLWDFGDVYAPACTTDTKNGININMNCRWSKDSINVKHFYTPGKEGCYTVTIFMIDTVRGCWDSDTAVMKLTTPNAHWDSTVTPIRRGVYYTVVGNPCLENPFTFYFDEVLPQCGYDTAWLLPDSACKPAVWIAVRQGKNKIDWVYHSTCDSSGWITYGVIVKNGEDDNGRTCYDTAWYHRKILLLPIKPFFKVTVNEKCQPYTLHLNLLDSIQDSMYKAHWVFQTHTSNMNLYNFSPPIFLKDTTIEQILLPTDSIIHGQTYVSPYQGLIYAELTLTNVRQCEFQYQTYFPVGYQKQIYTTRQRICVGDTVRLFDNIIYFNSSYPFWADTIRANKNLEKFWIDIGDGTGFKPATHNTVISYNKAGAYPIRMATQDSLGCRDTVPMAYFISGSDIYILDSNIYVSSLDAQIKHFDSIQFCAPFFVNLKDSSILEGLDSIGTWNWIFSDNKPHSTLQNPQHEFTSNGLFSVKLFVTTQNGCSDSITKGIYIKGPQPKFDIVSDTVGCQPLSVKFRNTTGSQLINWQWNFNDVNNTTFSTTKDTDIVFTYKVPGIYKIRLFGQDTIRDPATNTLKTCRAYFPDTTTNLPIRTVRVLPRALAKISGPDSICPNQIDTFIAHTDTTYNKFNWIFGDGNMITKFKPDTFITHAYSKSGIYKMLLAPQTSDPKTCLDTGIKIIFVNSIKADFDIDESQSPQYQFNNKSTTAVSYKWFIGTDLSNKFSEDINPNKTITDTGAVMICLQAFNAQGCWDTTCKEVKAKEHVMIPNVFTPDNNDGKNDAFDIDIVGFLKYEIVIYNRWGTIVFRGTKDGVGNDGVNWNGKEYNEGALCSAGTYFYIFKYRLASDTSDKNIHGTITLIRGEN